MQVRRFLSAAPLTLVLLAVPVNAALAFGDWPSRAVKIVVPFPAGSANDIAARLYADGLSRRWTRPVAIENKPDGDAVAGGGGFAGARDDHVLLYGTASMIAVNPLLPEAQAYDPVRDLAPIAAGASAILVIAVTSDLPAQSLKDLVTLAQAKPGQLRWGTGPSLPHFIFAATLRRHRLAMVHVPWRDGVTSQADQRAEHVHVLSHSLHAVANSVASGKMRILAVTSPQREPALPDVPTVGEAGFPEMEIEGLSGLFGPRDMPPELRDRIAADMLAVARDPVLQLRFQASSQRVLSGTPAEFTLAIGRQRIRIQQIMHIVDLKNAMK